MGLFQCINFLVLLSYTTLAIDIPSTPAWPNGRCTDKSLSIPSWIVSNYKVESGTATFQVDNRASASTDCCAFITCFPDKKTCDGSAGSDEMRVTWTTEDNGISVISISEFWYCGDEGDTTIFTASGSTTVTSCFGPFCASPITYLAPGSLTLPVPLTPAQPSPPPGYNAPKCANVGANQWTISDVESTTYTKSQCKQWYQPEQICIDPDSVDGSFIRKGQHLKLNITNNAISHEVTCDFSPTYDVPDLPSPLRCTGGQFNEITLDLTWSLSSNTNSSHIKVEELWYCLENPLTNIDPSLIVASGSTDLSMTCSLSYGITGTSDDVITVCTTKELSHALDGVQSKKVYLPPYSLETAEPVHGGCTFDSIINPTFYYRDMYFETTPFPPNDTKNATLARFDAGLTGPGFKDFFFYQNKAISGSGIDTVYTCSVYYDGQPKENHYNCTYSLNPHTKVITQTKGWKCADKDAAHPLYFEGSGSFDWSIDPYSSCSTLQNTIVCSWNDDMANLQPGIPYDIPRVTASLINVLPPDLGQPQIESVGESGSSDTVRVGGKWQKAA